MSVQIQIKPLSVNEVWQGKRFKTKKYRIYEKNLMQLLPDMVIPKGKLKVVITYGFSSVGSDIDNPCKPFLDVLQKRYFFDDKRIYQLIQSKEIVKKGNEYINFEIHEIKANSR